MCSCGCIPYTYMRWRERGGEVGAVKKRKVANDEEERKSQRHAWTEVKN